MLRQDVGQIRRKCPATDLFLPRTRLASPSSAGPEGSSATIRRTLGDGPTGKAIGTLVLVVSRTRGDGPGSDGL